MNASKRPARRECGTICEAPDSSACQYMSDCIGIRPGDPEAQPKRQTKSERIVELEAEVARLKRALGSSPY